MPQFTKPPPYRPKLYNSPEKAPRPALPFVARDPAHHFSAAAYTNPYQRCKVAVMDLARDTDRLDLQRYFEDFGGVRSVVIKLKPTRTYAFVQFFDDAAVERALAAGPHVVRHRPVRVLRAYKHRLTNCPFPGMDPMRSPVRQLRQLCEVANEMQRAQLMAAVKSALEVPQAPAPSPWDADTSLWEGNLYRSILPLWSN